MVYQSSRHPESESPSVVPDSLQPQGLYSLRNSPGQNTGVGTSSFISSGDLPNPGIKLGSPALQADSLPAELPLNLLIGPSKFFSFWPLIC